MRLRLGLMMGFAAGYVAGSAAGRERFEQMRGTANKLMGSEQVERAREIVEDKAQQAADKLGIDRAITLDKPKTTGVSSR
jgi:hypothetical protein